MVKAELNLPLKATNSICVQCENTSTRQKYIHIWHLQSPQIWKMTKG